MSEHSKSSDKNKLLELKEWCEVYKQHWEDVIRKDLTKKLAGAGLSEVEIHVAKDIEKFGEIKRRVEQNPDAVPSPLIPEDIVFIVNKVIKEPTGTFGGAHSSLYSAVQKYRAASALIETEDVSQFRFVLGQNLRDRGWGRDNNSGTAELIKKLKVSLNIPIDNNRVFSGASSRPANDTNSAADEKNLLQKPGSR
jgi:hypothetical protein